MAEPGSRENDPRGPSDGVHPPRTPAGTLRPSFASDLAPSPLTLFCPLAPQTAECQRARPAEAEPRELSRAGESGRHQRRPRRPDPPPARPPGLTPDAHRVDPRTGSRRRPSTPPHAQHECRSQVHRGRTQRTLRTARVASRVVPRVERRRCEEIASGYR